MVDCSELDFKHSTWSDNYTVLPTENYYDEIRAVSRFGPNSLAWHLLTNGETSLWGLGTMMERRDWWPSIIFCLWSNKMRSGSTLPAIKALLNVWALLCTDVPKAVGGIVVWKYWRKSWRVSSAFKHTVEVLVIFFLTEPERRKATFLLLLLPTEQGRVAKNVTGFQLSKPKQWVSKCISKGGNVKASSRHLNACKNIRQLNFRSIQGHKKNKADSRGKETNLVVTKLSLSLLSASAQQVSCHYPVGLFEVNKEKLFSDCKKKKTIMEGSPVTAKGIENTELEMLIMCR